MICVQDNQHSSNNKDKLFQIIAMWAASDKSNAEGSTEIQEA